MTFTIRRARPADAPVIIDFNCRLAQETEDKILDPGVVARGVQAVLDDANKAVYFVAEGQDGVIGQLSITYEWSDWRNGWIWWIQSVYVRADARRHGVFRALYDHLYEAARQDPQVIGIRLYVEKENHAAQQTYLNLGMEWAPYGVLQRYPL